MPVRRHSAARFLSMRWRFRVGAALFLLLFAFSFSVIALNKVDILPFSIGIFVDFISEIGLSLLIGGGLAGVLLALVACLPSLRDFILSLAAFLIPIPVIAFLAIIIAICPSSTSSFFAGFIGGFGLIWRIVHEVLASERNIPAAYFKTARVLRLNRWNIFCSIRVPVFSSALWRAYIRDIPDFWVRLLIGEIFLGDFSSALLLMRQFSFVSKILNSLEVVFLLGFFVFILLFCIIKPVNHYMVKYNYFSFEDKNNYIIFPLVLKYMIMAVLLGIVYYFTGFYNILACIMPFFYDISMVICILILSFSIWFIGGSLFLNRRKIRHHARYGSLFLLGAMLSTLPVVFPFYIILGFFLPLIIPVFLTVQASFGLSFLSLMRQKAIVPFIKTSFHLRLSFIRKLQVIFFPLLSRPLVDGLISIHALLWNVVFFMDIYFASFLGGEEKGISWYFVQDGFHHNIGSALTVSAILISLSILVLSFGLYPLRARISRKYGIIS